MRLLSAPTSKESSQSAQRRFAAAHLQRVVVLLVCCAMMATGCTPTFWRLQADRDAYHDLSQKTVDPRWNLTDYSIDPDTRSRYYDPYNPDKEPMPPDDPTAHRLMHCIDGMRGDGAWHINGDTPYTENPDWMAFLPQNEKGQIVVDISGAVQLGLLNSPAYQRELEDLYLSALDVTFERFRFDVQFFGQSNTFYESITGDGDFDSSTLTTTNALEARKLFANGGELMVGLANTLVWQFSSDDTNLSTTLLDFSLIQPLLRGGGRARVLERLTIAERGLLNNVRAMEQYRQGFYLNIVSGRNPGGGPQRRGGVLGGAGLSGFTGVGFGQISGGGGGTSSGGGGGAGAAEAGGYMGLLQDQQNIRNQEATVAALEDSLAELQAAYDAGRIDRFQVDQARQAFYNSRSQLLTNRASYQSTLDNFKITLGLPPDLDLEIDDPLLTPFQFIDPVIPPLQTKLTRLQETVGNQISNLRDMQAKAGSIDERTYRASLAAMLRSIQAAQEVQRITTEHFDSVQTDLNELRRKIPYRVSALNQLKKEGFSNSTSVNERLKDDPNEDLQGGVAPIGMGVAAAEDRDEIGTLIDNLEALPSKLASDLRTLARSFQSGPASLDRLQQELQSLIASSEERAAASDIERLTRIMAQLPDQLVNLSSDILELSLIQARARTEIVTLLPLEMDPADALLIASKNRLDWMNARSLLVDTWRLIQFNANDLMSVLNLVFDGDVTSQSGDPSVLNNTTGRLRVGVQFDAPLTRVAERNAYRQSLIEYQRARRDYYTFIDRVSQAVRSNLRQIDLDQANFELRRAAVRVAIDQVEITRLRLRQPPQPGVATTFGDTTARDLVSALSDLQDVQNDFLSVWVNFEVERMALDYNLGTMQIDRQGLWVDPGSAIGTVGPVPFGCQSTLEGTTDDSEQPLDGALWTSEDTANATAIGGPGLTEQRYLQLATAEPQPPPVLPSTPAASRQYSAVAAKSADYHRHTIGPSAQAGLVRDTVSRQPQRQSHPIVDKNVQPVSATNSLSDAVPDVDDIHPIARLKVAAP